MPQYNQNKASTPGREPEIKEGGGYRNRWTPIFDEYPMSLPVDWKFHVGLLSEGIGLVSNVVGLQWIRMYP